MNVAFVLLDGEVTGGQVVAHELMRGLRSAGHEAIAFVPTDGPMVARLRADGFEVVLLRLDRSYRLDQAIALARALRAAGADVVDTHTLFVGNQIARAAAAMARIPLVQHGHILERYSSRPAAATVQRTLDRATIRVPAAFVAVSEPVRDGLLGLGAPRSRVTVIPNGVSLPELSPPPPRPGLTILCAARLAPVKGQDVLLAALARTGPGIQAVFAGADLEGGAYERVLVEEAERLGVSDRIRLLGYRDDLPALLADVDALVLPSRDEGLPLVALEAMAHTRAVVATTVGGLPGLIADDENGLLVPPDSAEALAVALVRLRDEPELRTRLAVAGHAVIAAGFTVETMRARTIAVIERAVAGRGRD